MDLSQTVEALRRNNIELALDIGVHQFCEIDSNCPVAIELRRMIRDSGVSIVDLLETYASMGDGSVPEPPDGIRFEMPSVNGRVLLQIGGQDFELDLTAEIERQVGRELAREARSLEQRISQFNQLGTSMYQNYLTAIKDVKKTKEMPQVKFSLADIINYRCLITATSDAYLFVMPIQYKPEWIVSRGTRYRLSDEDIRTIEQEIFAVFPITRENKVLNVYVVNGAGQKFHHYHGRGGDCWGKLKMPERWDGTLNSLARLAYQMQASLATINQDSLMQHNPTGMPAVEDLRRRSTTLGVEGQLRSTDGEQQQPAVTGRGWGGQNA